MHVRQSLLLAGFGKYLAVGNPELDSWIIEALPLPHCLLNACGRSANGVVYAVYVTDVSLLQLDLLQLVISND